MISRGVIVIFALAAAIPASRFGSAARTHIVSAVASARVRLAHAAQPRRGLGERLADHLVAPARSAEPGPDVLYEANCAGCHGADGHGGAARGLVDPVYLQISDETTMRRVTSAGIRGTAMPPFAESEGGTLTDDQIGSIVSGIRSRVPGDHAAVVVPPPPYSTTRTGDPTRGAEVFATFCSSCHGADGRGGSGGSSIVDPFFLSLVSDQGLRTTVIAGRPDLGAPDWRGNVPGRPMSSQEVSEVVAWLVASRQE